MSATTAQSARTLTGTQRDWLVQMGALLNAPAKSADSAYVLPTGVSPEKTWKQTLYAVTDANFMVRDMEEANLSKAPVLRKGIELARTFADQKRYAEAVQAFKAVEPKIKEEYEKFDKSRGGGAPKGGGKSDDAEPAGAGKEPASAADPNAGPYQKELLRVGSKGPAVEYLQKALGGSLNCDGKFGTGTQDAVKAFQKSKGLQVDGIVGPKTWAALGGGGGAGGTAGGAANAPAGTTLATPGESKPSAPPDAAKSEKKPPLQPGDVVTVGDKSYIIFADEVRQGGSCAWRGRNPGNIRIGDKYGAIAGKKHKCGSSGKFAIFPDEATGLAAISKVLKGYGKVTVRQAMDKYAPSSDNNDPEAYAKTVAKKMGVETTTLVDTLTDAQLDTFAEGIKTVEGWKVGNAFKRDDARLPQEIRDRLKSEPVQQ